MAKPSAISFSLDYTVYEKGSKATGFDLVADQNGVKSFEDMLLFLRKGLILITDAALKEEQGKGFDKEPIFIVDGNKNKRVDQVSPFGKIEVVSRASVDKILLDTMEGLIERSPVDTALYITHHVVLVNGKVIATDRIELENWIKKNEFGPNDIVRFVNIMPYARRLERYGVTRQRSRPVKVKVRDKRRAAKGHKVLTPNGTYFLTYRSIKRKYKNNSSIRFSFISGSSLGIAKPVIQGQKTTFNKRKKDKKPRSYLYPTITIIPFETGIL